MPSLKGMKLSAHRCLNRSLGRLKKVLRAVTPFKTRRRSQNATQSEESKGKHCTDEFQQDMTEAGSHRIDDSTSVPVDIFVAMQELGRAARHRQQHRPEWRGDGREREQHLVLRTD